MPRPLPYVLSFLLTFAGSIAAADKPVALKAWPFALEDVKLLDGPFKDAMAVDRAFLLRLDVDRLMHTMRLTAGLKSPASGPYGGWERIGSQTIGHYLSACALMTASTGDAAVKERMNDVVDAIAACQRARPDGAVFVDRANAEWFEALGRGEVRPLPVPPWYLMHKNLAGLRDAWLHGHNPRARAALVRLADACLGFTAKLTPQQWQLMLTPEHGGPHEVLADVAAITGDPKYLDCARKFRHDRLFTPMLRGDESALYNIHANTQFPKFIGYERIYELTGDAPWHEAAAHFWEAVVTHLSWVNGGNSQWEIFFPPDEFPKKRDETCGPETCNTYNMLKLTRQLFYNDPQVRYVDYYERGLYNHILASQDPEHGGFVYYTSMRPGHYRVYSNDTDAFWCCVGTGMENHAKYGEMIYAHGQDDLYINLFIASELSWAEQALTLRQETHFPDDDRATLTLRLDRPARLALKVRCPGWAARGMTVRVNGVLEPAGAKPGTFVTLTRTWKTGDVVTIDVPKRLTVEYLPHSRGAVAFLAGPILLAGPLGAADLTPADFHGGEPLATKALPIARAPALADDQWLMVNGQGPIEPVAGRPLTFRTRALGRPDGVTLVPFFRVHHQRYVIYWRILSASDFAAEQQAQAEADRLERELERRTVDVVRPGEGPSESAHHVQGVNMATGPGPGTMWRHAGDGGWFSYDLKVVPDRPLALLCTYWGPDAGARTFDVVVEGRVIATQSLRGEHPGAFFDVRHDLPADLTRGRTKVTVTFQAHPGNIAGGLFGLRVIDGGNGR